MKTLPELVQSLPPELHDEIYKHTFTANPGEVYRIDGNSKPPALLQVDRESREIFAKSYYTSIFVMNLSEAKLFRKWFKRLPKAHLRMLQEVRVEPEFEDDDEEEKRKWVDVPVDVDFMTSVTCELIRTDECLSSYAHRDGEQPVLWEKLIYKVPTRVTRGASPIWMNLGEAMDLIMRSGLHRRYAEAMKARLIQEFADSLSEREH